jgi:hypothetical protein
VLPLGYRTLGLTKLGFTWGPRLQVCPIQHLRDNGAQSRSVIRHPILLMRACERI